MDNNARHRFSRRAFLASGVGVGGALTLAALTPSWMARAEGGRAFSLVAAPGRVHLLGARRPGTPVWSFNGTVPGPEIRVRQGERLQVAVENRLNEETTVHWHGVRVPHPMDGVPHLTQKPIVPGETFLYDFTALDAGTYWYHPHQRSYEQVGRGLYGPLIIEEHEPIHVDRDLTWVLDDWRLLEDGSISDDFGDRMDAGMSGRVGNTVTVNGRLPEDFHVRAGERIRLRLINGANGRIFGLEFEGHRPQIVALDGQPVEPHSPKGGRVLLGPGMRIDLVIDMSGDPGARFSVSDTFYKDLEYRLLDFSYADTPLRAHPLDAPIGLPANPLAEPELATALRHEVSFGGGMMSGMMGGDMTSSGMRGMHHDGIWTVNGVSASGHVMDPMLTLAHGRSHVLAMHNDTTWHHPIHLHGHSFRVLSRNGQATRYREWQDTVMMAPQERVEIAFVADNPGDWMFHCHILEHQAAGMMGVIRVS